MISRKIREREKCSICARDVGNGKGGLCNYCQKFHLPDPYGPDPLADCSVCFKVSPLFSCYFIRDRVVLCEPCYKNDRSMHRLEKT